MVRKAEEPLEQRHVKLFAGDFERLDRLLGGRLPPTTAIRLLVRQFVLRNEAKLEQQIQRMDLDVELPTEPTDETTDDPSGPSLVRGNL